MDSKLVYSSQFIVNSKTKTVNREPLTLNRSGFTLVELIIGFSIVGIISVLIASIYLVHSRLFSNQNTSIEVATQNKLGLDEMTNQIREGQQVAATCCSGETTSATTLVLQLWPLDASDEPFEPAGSAYDYMIYKRNPADNTKLIKRIVPDVASHRPASEKILASDISDLQFAYDNLDPTLSSEITITLTTTQTSSSRTFTNSQSSKAVLRNK